MSDRVRIVDVLPFFSNLAGRPVIDRTGLEGFYALALRWAPPRAPNSDAPVDDTPEFFTAIQEQLGLKVQPDTMKLPVFIVDSIERPSENAPTYTEASRRAGNRPTGRRRVASSADRPDARS